jgi:hypothetical protein
VLEPHRAVLAQLPPSTHWVSLELSYRDAQAGLGMMLVSTSSEARTSIRSVLNWVESISREGWVWRAGSQFNTLLGIFNSDEHEAKISISLDYYSQGIRNTYDLPERVMPPRSAELLNIGDIVRAQAPDKDGDVIPLDVEFGGYSVRKLGSDRSGNLTTEALIFSVGSGPLLSVYNTGCCENQPYICPNPLTGCVDHMSGQAETTGSFKILANNSCTGEPDDLTDSSFLQYASTNSGVAYGDLLGTMRSAGAGTATVWASQVHHSMISKNGSCAYNNEASAPCFVTVTACATPTNYSATFLGADAQGTLNFRYTWSSTTGNQSDLAACSVGETVFYPGTDPRYIWPLPMVQTTDNPFPLYSSGSNAGFDDHNIPPNNYQTPYFGTSFNATQRLQWSCPCHNNGNFERFEPDITIMRSIFKDADNFWYYKIEKSGQTKTVKLPNQ